MGRLYFTMTYAALSMNRIPQTDEKGRGCRMDADNIKNMSEDSNKALNHKMKILLDIGRR